MSTEDNFWQSLKDVRTGLIQVSDSYVPMTHFCDSSNHSVYFVTASGTATADAATQGGYTRYLICSDKQGLYADISGQLSVEPSRDKLEEVWNIFAAAWFDGDIDDPEICLARFKLTQASVWFATGNPFSFFYQIAKGNLTEKQPDLGSHELLTFR